MNDEARQLAIRLAEAFEVVPFTLREEMNFDNAAEWLGIAPEEVRFLVQSGLLRGTVNPETIGLKDLVAFLEETDWLRLRAARVQAHLATTLEELQDLPAVEL